MKTKFVLASFSSVMGGLALLPVSARADNGHSDGDRFHASNLHSVITPPQAAQGPYGPYLYGQGREVRQERRDDSQSARPRGYWKDVVVKCWVPAHWEYTYDGDGRQQRDFQLGRDEWRTQRVWVEGCP